MGDGEELAMEFYKPGSAPDLAECLINFLTNPEKQLAMGVQNFSTALRMTMPTIVQKYLRHFELAQRTDALRQVTRFRRLPKWMPSKAFLLRLMTRNSSGWIYRSANHGTARYRNSRNNSRVRLLNDDANGGRELTRTGIPLNGNGVVGGRGNRNGSALGRPHLVAATGNGNHSDAEQRDKSENSRAALARDLSHEGKSGNSEG